MHRLIQPFLLAAIAEIKRLQRLLSTLKLFRLPFCREDFVFSVWSIVHSETRTHETGLARNAGVDSLIRCVVAAQLLGSQNKDSPVFIPASLGYSSRLDQVNKDSSIVDSSRARQDSQLPW